MLLGRGTHDWKQPVNLAAGGEWVGKQEDAKIFPAWKGGNAQESAD